MAFTLEQVERLNGVILCSANGDPVPVTSVDIVSTVNGKTGESRDELHISGLAEGYLANPTNPQSGVKSLEEPLEVSVVQVLSESTDVHILLQQLSRWLKLPKPLEQDENGDWLDQLVPNEDPNSVSSLLKSRGIYVKLAKAKDVETKLKFGQIPFYVNVHLMPDREALTKEKVASLKEKWKAKRAAAEAATSSYE